MSQRVHVGDLGTIARVYDEEQSPELTVRVPKGKGGLLQVGERVTLTNAKGPRWNLATAECEGEVVAVAVIVKPDLTTLRNPHAEREQGSLL